MPTISEAKRAKFDWEAERENRKRGWVAIGITVGSALLFGALLFSELPQYYAGLTDYRSNVHMRFRAHEDIAKFMKFPEQTTFSSFDKVDRSSDDGVSVAGTVWSPNSFGMKIMERYSAIYAIKDGELRPLSFTIGNRMQLATNDTF